MNSIPIISVVGISGVGKTTFIEKLIPELKRRGFKVGTIKHNSHGFEMDKPGKDSWRHKKAGADLTLLSSPTQIGMVMDVDHDYDQEELIPFFQGIDIIIAEGYKRGDKPKFEIFRPEIQNEPFCRGDEHLVAIISDSEINSDLPRFSLNDAKGVADFIVKQFNLQGTQINNFSSTL